MRFYVYQLSDPRDGSVFYVGKGKDLRAWQHLALFMRGSKDSNARKRARIAQIVNAGLKPSVTIVERYEDEADAFEHEAELIASTKGLTNILARGGGWSITVEEAQRRAVERKERIARERNAKSIAYLQRWLETAETWPGVTFPGLKDGDQKAARFLADVRALLAQSNI